MAKFSRTVGPFTKDESYQIAERAIESDDVLNAFVRYLQGDIESANLAHELDLIFECAWISIEEQEPDTLDDIYGEVR